jgi:hypothetical protein
MSLDVEVEVTSGDLTKLGVSNLEVDSDLISANFRVAGAYVDFDAVDNIHSALTQIFLEARQAELYSIPIDDFAEGAEIIAHVVGRSYGGAFSRIERNGDYIRDYAPNVKNGTGGARIIISGTGLSLNGDDQDYSFSQVRFLTARSGSPRDFSNPELDLLIDLDYAMKGGLIGTVSFGGFSLKTDPLSIDLRQEPTVLTSDFSGDFEGLSTLIKEFLDSLDGTLPVDTTPPSVVVACDRASLTATSTVSAKTTSRLRRILGVGLIYRRFLMRAALLWNMAACLPPTPSRAMLPALMKALGSPTRLPRPTCSGTVCCSTPSVAYLLPM